MRIAILGAGPAGLIAAHAAVELGHEVKVYSRKVPSQMYGAMFLHAPVPGVSPEQHELEIDVIKSGEREGYAMNVYGDPEAPVSWDRFEEGVILAWSLPEAYRQLWKMYEDLIVPCEVSAMSARGLVAMSDVTFTTIYARTLCRDSRHEFKSQRVCIVHGPKTDGREQRNMMYYNGWTPDGLMDYIGFDWYRYSLINRYESWEYRDGQVPFHVEKEAVPPHHTVSYGEKPIWTTCDCNPEIIRLGRFGQWDKNTFVHHSYEAVRNALLKL